MLWEVADSLWMLLRTNLTLLLSAVGTLVSAILGGGHAVLKFLFHTVKLPISSLLEERFLKV